MRHKCSLKWAWHSMQSRKKQNKPNILFDKLCPIRRDSRLMSIGGGADEVMLGIICKYMDMLPKK